MKSNQRFNQKDFRANMGSGFRITTIYVVGQDGVWRFGHVALADLSSSGFFASNHRAIVHGPKYSRFGWMSTQSSTLLWMLYESQNGTVGFCRFSGP